MQRFEAGFSKETRVSAAELRLKHVAAIPWEDSGMLRRSAISSRFFVSDRAAYVTGAVFRIDGGLAIGF